MRKNSLTIVLLAIFVVCGKIPQDIPGTAVLPTQGQIEYQKMELIGFVHFTVNTFTDREWGYGDETPSLFNPSELNTEQWARTAKAAGMKQLILTAKHHDGFCLWPSQYTEHSVKNSPWKDGKGDVVQEFTDACRKYGLKAGLYLSPWDRNHAEYGSESYLEYYKNQLTELLTQYGPISEIWFDGANGGDGYYGGANEERRIDRKNYYQWDTVFRLVKQLQPGIQIFSDAGPDIRWIGNEQGFAGETNWSMINNHLMTIGGADAALLNTGDPWGAKWVTGECDVSIRPGWFYHTDEDNQVKSPHELMDIYFKSVGRNGVLLLNIPPDRRGLFHEKDVDALLQFRGLVDSVFAVNLASEKKVTADQIRENHARFSPAYIVDESQLSYWAADDGVKEAALEIDLGAEVEFDVIMIQEPIRFGQRISRFSVDGWINNRWESLAEGTTIGYKRLLRIDPAKSKKIRLTILNSRQCPAISNFGIFKTF